MRGPSSLDLSLCEHDHGKKMLNFRVILRTVLEYVNLVYSFLRKKEGLVLKKIIFS